MLAAAAAHDALFDVRRDLPWYVLNWTGDPDWPKPANGVGIASLRDGTGSGHHAVQASAGLRPLFIASGINGQPTARGDGVNDYLSSASAITPSPAQPYTVAVVAKYAAPPGASTRIVGTGSSNGQGLGTNSSGSRGLFLGNTIASGAPNTNSHLFVGVANGVSSIFQQDGVTLVTGNAGNGALGRLTMFAAGDGGTATAADSPFAAIGPGDMTLLPRWADFKAWVTATYGIIVA